MSRLAPGSSTNIHPASGLYRLIFTPEERHEATGARMTLAAACVAMRERTVPYYPANAAVCGCGRCGR